MSFKKDEMLIMPAVDIKNRQMCTASPGTTRK